MALWRIDCAGTNRWAAGSVADGPRLLLPDATCLDDLLAGKAGALAAVASATEGAEVPADARILAPLGAQPVWAAGVTFERSREARNEESGGIDLYGRVYEAERPELFLKALPGTVRGPGAPVGVRSDSTWDVPEPELAVVVDAHGEIVAYTIGNDVSSRSIEGANALYLPQAKLYTGSCAVGPCLVTPDEAVDPADMTIELRIARDGRPLFEERTSVSSMHRRLEELVAWLRRGTAFPCGVVLLTGTSIVPEAAMTLRDGDEVSIAITGLGLLRNVVETVGTGQPPAAEALDTGAR